MRGSYVSLGRVDGNIINPEMYLFDRNSIYCMSITKLLFPGRPTYIGRPNVQRTGEILLKDSANVIYVLIQQMSLMELILGRRNSGVTNSGVTIRENFSD